MLMFDPNSVLLLILCLKNPGICWLDFVFASSFMFVLQAE